MMRFLLLVLAFGSTVHAADFVDISRDNGPSVVYLEVRDETGAVLNKGTGFIVSHEGHIATVAHLEVAPSERMVAIIGQRQGTAFTLDFRDTDVTHDVALWQLPQSLACRRAVILGTAPVETLDQVLVLGFPRNDGLTSAPIGIRNTRSAKGFYKADGYLEPGNSGGPVFNERGEVVAIVQGGTLPGTESNDLVPIAPAIALIQRVGARAGINQGLAYSEQCYSACRHESHGIASWQREENWGPENSGWLPGGHTRPQECGKLVAAAIASNPGAQIELLPGDAGMWEESEKDFFGHTEYKYFCRGVLRSGPIYVEKRSPACSRQE